MLGYYFNLMDPNQKVIYYPLPIQKFTFGEKICLSFSYMLGTLNRINVYVKKDNYINHLVWLSTNETKSVVRLGASWKKDYVDINSYDNQVNYNNYEIIFEIIKGTSQIDNIGIDEIEISKAMCLSKK